MGQSDLISLDVKLDWKKKMKIHKHQFLSNSTKTTKNKQILEQRGK